jgi:hypothetical protein
VLVGRKEFSVQLLWFKKSSHSNKTEKDLLRRQLNFREIVFMGIIKKKNKKTAHEAVW